MVDFRSHLCEQLRMAFVALPRSVWWRPSILLLTGDHSGKQRVAY